MTLGSGSAYAYLYFEGDSQTLGGNGTVVFSGSGPYDSLGLPSGTLTIGSGITVQGQTGYVGYSPEIGGSFSSIAVVNQGTIQASVSGGTITVEGGSIQNTGTLDAANGGTLDAYSSSFTTTGTIEADAGSTISIGGTIDNTRQRLRAHRRWHGCHHRNRRWRNGQRGGWNEPESGEQPARRRNA